jgi:hypothetical protein
MKHSGGEKFVVELEALPDDAPAHVRVRAALKHLWRSHKLRCRSVVQVKGGGSPAERPEVTNTTRFRE